MPRIAAVFAVLLCCTVVLGAYMISAKEQDRVPAAPTLVTASSF
jgi:hypothetical protein